MNSIKIAYIYNLAKFTRWPSTTWNSSSSPFVFCAYGKGELSVELQRLQEKEISGHPITFVQLNNELDFKQCNALYIDPVERRCYRFLLSLIKSGRVLTISEDSSFLRHGGLIALVEKEQRLRFEVNMQALSGGTLKLSAKLLNLAILYDDPR